MPTLTVQQIGGEVVENYETQAWLPGGGYVFLIWPKTATNRDLNYMRGIVNFQIDSALKWADDTAEKRASAWWDSLIARCGHWQAPINRARDERVGK